MTKPNETPSGVAPPPAPFAVPPVEPLAAPPVAPLVSATYESVLTLADADPHQRTRPKPFYVASQWHIMPGEADGTIEAVNNTTGDRYEGTIIDFNDMLKGN